MPPIVGRGLEKKGNFAPNAGIVLDLGGSAACFPTSLITSSLPSTLRVRYTFGPAPSRRDWLRSRIRSISFLYAVS